VAPDPEEVGDRAAVDDADGCAPPVDVAQAEAQAARVSVTA
jgi:hypothetical protein